MGLQYASSSFVTTRTIVSTSKFEAHVWWGISTIKLVVEGRQPGLGLEALGMERWSRRDGVIVIWRDLWKFGFRMRLFRSEAS